MNPMNPIKFDRNAIHMHRITISSNCSGHFCWSFYGSPTPFKNHRAERNLAFLSGNHAEAWAHGGGSIYMCVCVLYILLGHTHVLHTHLASARARQVFEFRLFGDHGACRT